METEYYRSQTDLLPTFSLVLAVSLGGLAPIAPPVIEGDYTSPALAHYDYYEPVSDQVEQVETMKRFAENLLAKTEDSPQEVVEIINRHFWELV